MMALYKFNTFHLHLTDDQGWRIEIKKYPKLTEEGAWRTFNNQDSACMLRAKDNADFVIDKSHIIHKDGKTLYGGFYTQQQMKDVVAYALARHITIIPEIDMPGHMMAAINAYNYLSCDGKSAFGELFSIPICPCLPATYQFAQDIFTEIMDIFPSEYIHIGGDEVDRSYWEKSDACKTLMEKEGLKTSAELQSYFIRKMEEFFNSKGRKIIGWDEILDGGVTKTAAIMYWRTWVPKAPLIAAKNGNKVIMSPGNPLYFDYQPDKNSLSNVYHFNLIPEGLNKEEAKNIIGAQANLWAEQVPTEERADYMIMPRMTALAENLWSNHDDYKSYLQRLKTHYSRLDLLNVNYRFPDLPLMDQYVFTDKATLKLEKTLI
ncbi:MAG: family 20 glycosylhydrolase [Ferruginibacter sp.]